MHARFKDNGGAARSMGVVRMLFATFLNKEFLENPNLLK